MLPVKNRVWPSLLMLFFLFSVPAFRNLLFDASNISEGRIRLENAKDQGDLSLSYSVQQCRAGTSNTSIALASYKIPDEYFHAGAAHSQSIPGNLHQMAVPAHLQLHVLNN